MAATLLGFVLLIGCQSLESGEAEPYGLEDGGSSGVYAKENATGAASEQVIVTVSSTLDELSASDDVLVTVTLSNPTDQPLRIPEFTTAANGIHEDVFDVTRDGVEVPYIGIMFDRTESQVRYITLPPRQSLTYTLSLADAYDFSTSGIYKIRHSHALEHGTATFRSNAVELSIEGRPDVLSGEPSRAKSVTPRQCGTARAEQIRTAFRYAKQDALSAYSYLYWTKPANTARWAKYFGRYTLRRWNTVKGHFAKISSAFNEAVVVHCDCDPAYRHVNGYVHPNRAYHIWVCDGFWGEPVSGPNSRAGTLLHELSHLKAVVGSSDSQADPINSAYRLTWFATKR